MNVAAQTSASPMENVWSPRKKAAAAIVLLALVVLPAPLLPPHGLAQLFQATLGLGWKSAYLAAAIGLHAVLYGSLGLLAALAMPAAMTRGMRWLQLIIVPAVVVLIVVIIRSIKLGHVPVITNAALPMIACFGGVALGLLFSQHGWRVTAVAAAVVLAALMLVLLPATSSRVSKATEGRLRHLVSNASDLPSGEQRFLALLQRSFSADANELSQYSAIEINRAALLALGIALGHERLSRFAGLDNKSDLVRQAALLRAGTTLSGREDWARHFSLSAALTALENSFVSDAGGLMKEQLDALTHGSGFSFGDLAADRAGVRFATAATDSTDAAVALKKKCAAGAAVADFFPEATDLPENLTVEQFRRDFGGVGDRRYREQVRQIEARLDKCAFLKTNQS
jgi:hypothetical protein